jgi:hypothetical protein
MAGSDEIHGNIGAFQSAGNGGGLVFLIDADVIDNDPAAIQCRN